MNIQVKTITPESTPAGQSAKLDYWWYKENLKQLTTEIPLSRVNSAKKLLNSDQIYLFKMIGSRTVKASMLNLKKNQDITTEISVTPWNDLSAKELPKIWEECHNEIIALINGELTKLLSEECQKNRLDIFLLPANFSWKCNCALVNENPDHLCEHVLAVAMKLLEECKYMPILYFQFRGFGLSEFKQLFFDLPIDDSGRAELPDFLTKEFFAAKFEPIQTGEEWVNDYYGHSHDYTEISGKELEPFSEQQYYHHKFNRDFYESLEAIKKEMGKFWHLD